MLILQLVLRPELGVELTQGRSSSSCRYGILCNLQRPCLHGRVLGGRTETADNNTIALTIVKNSAVRKPLGESKLTRVCQ